MSQPKPDDSKTESEVTAPEMSHPQEGDNISEAQNVTEVSQEKVERPKTPVEEYQSVPDAPPQAGQMYGGDDDQTSSSESEVELETVKNADARERDNPFRDNFVMDRFHSDLMLDNPNSDDDDSSDLLEREFRQGSNLEDIFFQDLSPEVHHSLDRLDTVEEVTEPASSEFFPDEDEAARIGSSGQPSSDFQQDSLPPDYVMSLSNLSAKNSITSREEVFSISEIDVIASTWPPNITTHTPVRWTNGVAPNAGQTYQVDEEESLPFTNLKDVSDEKHPTSTDKDKPADNVGSADTSEGSLQDSRPIPSEPTSSIAITLKEDRLTSLRRESAEIIRDGSKEDESTSSGLTSEASQLLLTKGQTSKQEQEQHQPGTNNHHLGNVDDHDEDTNESDSEELSISLPSEGQQGINQVCISSKFSHVRNEILRILSTDDEGEDLREEQEDQTSGSSSDRFKDRAHIYVVNGDEDEEIEPDDEDESSSLADDLLKFSEKHEFEDAEKSRTSKRNSSTTMSTALWSSEDVVDDASCMAAASPPVDNDSGIDRDAGAGSRVSGASMTSFGDIQHHQHRGSTKIWTKIHKTVRRRFGGSTGSLSSASPVSEQEPRPPQGVGDIFYSPEIARMESPREGGFPSGESDGGNRSVAMMKAHIKELMSKLAKAEEDKQKIADEAYRRSQIIKREAEAKLESAGLAQAKQASLVDRLQSKVLKYKEQCQVMENRLFEVNNLANQSQIRLNDTNQVLKSLEERLRTTEDQHLAEVRRLQVKLEEQEEKSNTLGQVNSVLRDQLDKAGQNNAALVGDLKRLANDWDKLNRELVHREEQWKLFTDTKANLEQQKVLNLWQDVATFRRQFADLKMSTEKELVTVKNDLSNTGRNLTNACLNVYTKSNYLNVGDGGKAVHVGSKHDMWMQLQRVKVEKQLVEKQRFEVEEKYKRLTRQTDEINKKLRDIQEAKEELAKENARLRQQDESHAEKVSKAIELESHLGQLQNSLFDIAQIVLEDADKQEQEDLGGDQTMNFKSSVFVTPSSSNTFRTMASPSRGRSASLPRRTRSASPAVMESTLTAVQAALNRRQLQVHELRTKLIVSTEKVEEMSKSLRAKDDLLESVEQKLEKERLESDSLKISLDEVRREKLNVQERLEMLHVEKAAAERSRANLQVELDSLSKEKSMLTETNSKLSRELQLMHAEHDHLTKTNEKLNKENKDKMNLISQLEKVGSSLREELLVTKNELQKTTKALEVSNKEKADREESANTLQLQSNLTEEERIKLKKEEKLLKETLAKLEASKDALTRNSQALETQLSKVEEEKLKLLVEVSEYKATVQTLKEELNESQHKVTHLTKEKTSLQELLKSEELIREKLESDLKRASVQRDEVDNQLTSVTLQKDAFQDEVTNVRKEMIEIRTHLDRVCEENAQLNKHRSELEVRLEHCQKEMSQMDERIKFLRAEKSEQFAMVDEMQMELDECTIQRKKLEDENLDMKTKLENLKIQAKSLQSELDEELLKSSSERSKLEMERDELKENSNKVISKLKSELEEAEDLLSKEKDEAKRLLEKKLREETSKVSRENGEKIQQLELELAEFRAECDRLKQAHSEDSVMAESEKQQALLMAQQELHGMREKLDDVNRSLEESRNSLEKLKRESSMKSEKERLQIGELQLEVSRLKSQLEEKVEKYEGIKASLVEQLNREKEAKYEMESQFESARNELLMMTGRADTLADELYDTKRKLGQALEAKSYLQDELNGAEQRLAETKHQVDLLDKIKSDLQNSMRHLELEKLEDQKMLQRADAQIAGLEKGSLDDRREIIETHEKCKMLDERNNQLEDQIDSLQRQLKSLQLEYREIELQLESYRDRSVDEDEQRESVRRESQQLRIRLTEMETSKIALERDMATLRSVYSSEEEAVKLKMQAMNQAMEEMRTRERKLEDQRHNLELSLSDAHQEIKALNISLTGYEGRMNELHSTIARLETSKKDVEAKLTTVCGQLQQFRAPTSSASRPATPTRTGRSSVRRASSPWSSGHVPNVSEIDIEAVKSNIRELMARINQADRERDESLHQVSTLKRQNDELLMNTVHLEGQLNKSKQKINGTEEQLRKLEHKVSISDVSIANQEVELQKRERELKQLSAKLEATSKQLEDLQNYGTNSDDEVRHLRTEKTKLENDKRRLQESLSEAEGQISRLEVTRKSLGGDQNRLQSALNEKESEIKNLRSKCESLSRGISGLEDKCSALSSTVDNLNLQLERSVQNESDLQCKVTELSRSLNATSSSSHEIQDQVSQLQRALSVAENEKKVLEDRLESSRGQSHDLKRSQDMLQEKLALLQADLQRSESRANQCELALQSSRAQLENNAQDNYLREELGRMRRENDDMQQRIKDLSKKISMVESDKEDLEKRLQHRSRHSSAFDQAEKVDHVRAQIPLMGGRSPFGTSSPHHGHGHHHHLSGGVSPIPMHMHHHHCGEHMVKIRILEQENERQLRKIRALEQQLSELEQLHGARVQELLQERRRERDKENQRQKEALKQMETSLSAREKIFKERIVGLEGQVDVLKDQLSKEMRRRQTLIAGTSGISHEISELRQNLDQSLYNVSSSAESRLDAQVLDREAGRLNMTVDRYGADLTSRLTPSKLRSSSTPVLASTSGGQRIGLSPSSYLPKTKRTLTFDMET